MSTGGQIAGGVVGGVIGAVVGGPTGAIYGAQIGMSVGGLLDPPKGPTVEGPRLGDLSVQTSTYGQFIPRTYGTIGLSGNVFWLENNKIKEVVRKKKSGGKGGGSSSTVKTYTYFATFAVGLCEGPIAGVRRIWVGPDLVYDAGSDDLETIISSNQASAKFTIYTGTDTQQPDPRMQAEMGVANCPAYRGLAYVVVKDLALANYGNSVAGAQVKVEVANSVEVVGATSIGSAILSGTPRTYKATALNCTPDANVNVYRSTADLYVTGQCEKTTYIPPIGSEVKSPPITEPSNFAYSQGWSDIDECIFWKSSGELISLRDRIQYVIATSAVAANAGQQEYKIYRRDGKSLIISQSSTVYPSSSVVSDVSSGSDSIVSVTTASSPDGRIHDIFLGADSYYAITSKPHFVCYDKSWVKKWHVDCTGVISPPSHIIGDGHTKIRERSDGSAVISKNGAGFFLVSESGILPIGVISSIDGYDGYGGDHLIWPLWLSYSAQHNRVTKVSLANNTFNAVPLSTIFTAEAERSALIKPADIDATGLTDSVTGFKVTATGSIRNAIEPLRGAWPFDVVQSGYKIKATSRGSASVVTIPIGELAIDTQLTESREMDSQLPQNVTVKYIDRERDYDANEQRAQRDNTEAVNSLVLELPVVLSATQSAQVADKLIRIYALEKSDFAFTLPAPYRYLEPGDVVTIAAADADYVLRLVSVNHTADGRLECSGRPSSAATYTSIAPGDGGQHGGTVIPLTGATIGILIDCPVIDEGLQKSPGFAVGMNGYSAGWPGGILYRTADNGQTWDDLQALDGRATAGYASGVLTASAGNLIQRGGSLVVSLIGGTLESVTEAQMLNGANIAAYGANGRWEILQFQNATLNIDGTYTLDTFWRGDKGTEWATGLHAANDYFVLMTDPDLAFVGMPTDSIGQPRDYRAVTAGTDIDSAASQAFTYSAVNLETLSGVHPRGSRSAGDLTITWQRRTRVGGAWRDFVDVSLGESSESYEVDIMDGATVKRTISATTPSVLYTSAMQVTDFGSAQSSVTVNIYQLSAVVGRGYKLEATL